MKYRIFVLALLFIMSNIVFAKPVKIYPFGEKGKIKMLYDRRQRTQAVFLDNKIHIVYNGNSIAGNKAKNAKAQPMYTAFDLSKKQFSVPYSLDERSSDHHFSAVIWSHGNGEIQSMMGCHKTPGKHLRAKLSENGKLVVENWKVDSPLNNSMSYPSIYSLGENRSVAYFRHEGHRGSWRYLLSEDGGKSWSGPEKAVTDLNMGGEKLDLPPEKMDEKSSYQTCFPSKDGKFLHVAFSWYDDNKEKVPEKFYNPRYKTKKNLGLKYNLYYLKINLINNEVRNFNGDLLEIPIDMDQANSKCLIWDTEWRGTGVPPDIILDENDQPSFLHGLTEDSPDQVNYYYVNYKNGAWEQTKITKSCHEWNGACIVGNPKSVLKAYLIVGEGYLKGGFNDKHGGGNIEEWVSTDGGVKWHKNRDITKGFEEYSDWRYNNIRPIRRHDRSILEGAFMFYGWKDPEQSEAKAFLLIDDAEGI